MAVLRKLLTALAEALGEKSCFLCGAALSGESLREGLCPDCLQKLAEEAALPCPLCGCPTSGCFCGHTNLSPLHIFLNDRTWLAHTWYLPDSPDRRTEKLLLTCKKKYSRTLSRHIAQVMAGELSRILPPEKRKGWILTYAPRSSVGYARHGFDQCEEIVRIMGSILGIPVQKLLVRVSGGIQKDMESAARREDNMADAFAALSVPDGCRVLLFDDIITTGATMRAAGKVLADAGAGAVFPLAYAKTVHPKGRKN